MWFGHLTLQFPSPSPCPRCPKGVTLFMREATSKRCFLCTLSSSPSNHCGSHCAKTQPILDFFPPLILSPFPVSVSLSVFCVSLTHFLPLSTFIFFTLFYSLSVCLPASLSLSREPGHSLEDILTWCFCRPLLP